MTAIRPLLTRLTGLLTMLLLVAAAVLAPPVRGPSVAEILAAGDTPPWVLGEICGQLPDGRASGTTDDQAPGHERRDCIAHCLSLGLSHALPALLPGTMPAPHQRLLRSCRGLRSMRRAGLRRRGQPPARAPPTIRE